ncbi:hypothetical protein ACFUIV_38100 [Streptomyces anulatus]|uniref:hypothetical protein n=1 Tax=Streptomyces anulatus TaxID=1892 RepID=UPI00362EA44C
MTKNAKIGAALVGGYLLGRTKKAKFALGFGMFLLGKRIDLDPRQIGRMLADSPVLGSLNDQVRKELVDATRAAATKAVTQRAGSLADSLQQRTQALGAGPGDDEQLDEEDDEPRTAADEHEVEADEGEDTGGERKRTPRRTAAASDSKPVSRRRSSSDSGRSGSGGKSAPARKRTGGARKTAASGARKARGGDDA